MPVNHRVVLKMQHDDLYSISILVYCSFFDLRRDLAGGHTHQDDDHHHCEMLTAIATLLFQPQIQFALSSTLSKERTLVLTFLLDQST